MKRYASNILIYIAALFGIIAFIGMFSSPLQSYNEINDAWVAYKVKAYIGEVSQGVKVYNGTFYPIIGYTVPFVLSIFLIIESFKPSLRERIAAINTILAILYFLSAVLVLLTKELFLNANNFGDTLLVRNGVGPIMAAICSSLAGVILLVVTWMPGQKPVDFIVKE